MGDPLTGIPASSLRDDHGKCTLLWNADFFVYIAAHLSSFLSKRLADTGAAIEVAKALTALINLAVLVPEHVEMVLAS